MNIYAILGIFRPCFLFLFFMENDFFKPTHPTKVWKIHTFFEGFPKWLFRQNLLLEPDFYLTKDEEEWIHQLIKNHLRISLERTTPQLHEVKHLYCLLYDNKNAMYVYLNFFEMMLRRQLRQMDCDRSTENHGLFAEANR